MDEKFRPPKTIAASEYFVEVIAPDGVTHHVGPFRARARAEDWIAQHASTLTIDRAQVAWCVG